MEYARGAIKNKAGYKAADASGSVTSLIPAARLCACVCVCVCACTRVCVGAIKNKAGYKATDASGSANSLISAAR